MFCILQDGADVELSWQMHVNPDSILSLDTEARASWPAQICQLGCALWSDSHEGGARSQDGTVLPGPA